MSILSQLDRSPGAGEPREELALSAPLPLPKTVAVAPSQEEDEDEDAFMVRASNGTLDLTDPETAREEAADIVASRAEGAPQAAIGRGLFDQQYGPGALERFLESSGLTVVRTRKQGLVFLFDLVGRGLDGQPDVRSPAVSVSDTGTHVQIKQKPPSAEMIALALVEVARMKGWPSINIESHGAFASDVRKHVKQMGMDVVEPGQRGAAVSPGAHRRPAGFGMG